MWNWLVQRFQKFLGLEKIREIRIVPSVLHDLCGMARDAHPNEMLAFISATQGVRNGILIIDEIQLQAYDASVTSATVPVHLLPTVSSIVGTVHSHPSSSRRPSRQDKNLFSNYGFIHGIMGYPYEHHTITFYDKEGNEIPVHIENDRK